MVAVFATANLRSERLPCVIGNAAHASQPPALPGADTMITPVIAASRPARPPFREGARPRPSTETALAASPPHYEAGLIAWLASRCENDDLPNDSIMWQSTADRTPEGAATPHREALDRAFAMVAVGRQF
jgi:hypothetical protein